VQKRLDSSKIERDKIKHSIAQYFEIVLVFRYIISLRNVSGGIKYRQIHHYLIDEKFTINMLVLYIVPLGMN
jgi:hypothetical protein